uniref:Uncharacterized protein n=1 Tax=Arundo donax TaxID=35708 RepID=A0A0A9FNG6_ARUDO
MKHCIKTTFSFCQYTNIAACRMKCHECNFKNNTAQQVGEYLS